MNDSFSPYERLDDRAYWRLAVATRGPGRLRDLYRPRFAITQDSAILTAGSCFAQHVHQALKAAAFRVIETEPAPAGVLPEVAARFFYGVFSARYGNIYNPRHLLQLLQESQELFSPAHPVWSRAGRFYDALRPNVDPGGFATAQAVAISRKAHLRHVARAVAQVDVVIFTLGLHETWQDRASGTVYPTAPGVLATPPSGAQIGFHAFSHNEIVADVEACLSLLRQSQPDIKLLLTVAPGPLVATAGADHVLVASTAGKAILRAAVETLMAGDHAIDYFPSYEIITNPAARGALYQANLRHPTPKGVSVVMKTFMAAHGAKAPQPQPEAQVAARTGRPLPEHVDRSEPDAEKAASAICEEMLNDPAYRQAGRAYE